MTSLPERAVGIVDVLGEYFQLLARCGEAGQGVLDLGDRAFVAQRAGDAFHVAGRFGNRFHAALQSLNRPLRVFDDLRQPANLLLDDPLALGIAEQPVRVFGHIAHGFER